MRSNWLLLLLAVVLLLLFREIVVLCCAVPCVSLCVCMEISLLLR